MNRNSDSVPNQGENDLCQIKEIPFNFSFQKAIVAILQNCLKR